MIYKLANYRKAIYPQVKLWCDAKGGDPLVQIPNIALATSAPILVVSAFVGELYGQTPELDRYVDRIKKFYHDGVEE